MTGNDLGRMPLFEGKAGGCLTFVFGLTVAAGIWCGGWYLAAMMVRLVFLG